jgi:hypothetical protein
VKRQKEEKIQPNPAATFFLLNSSFILFFNLALDKERIACSNPDNKSRL